MEFFLKILNEKQIIYSRISKNFNFWWFAKNLTQSISNFRRSYTDYVWAHNVRVKEKPHT